MPHTRKRYLETILKKCLNFSSLVGVLGHRQVGKTTLIERLGSAYYTLDVKKESDEARADPAKYLKARHGDRVVIDECQTVPELFPELKEWVRKHKRPGQFILSGSVRFTSREGIRESLTGRIVNLELLPMTLSEQNGEPLNDFCVNALAYKNLDVLPEQFHFNARKIEKTHQAMRKYFEQGGLPGVCFIRDESLRTLRLDEQLNTILDRDLRQVKNIQLSLRDLRALFRSFAAQQGEVINYTRIKEETGISAPTIKKVMFAMEAVFLFRTLSVEGGAARETLFFEDLGEWNRILSGDPTLIQQLTHFCFTHVRTQFSYRLEESTEAFQYRTRGGALIPLAFKNKNGVLGIVPVSADDQAESVMGSVNSFLKTYAQSNVLIVHPEVSRLRLIQSRVLVVPAGAIV
jgi:predicted AAA+ superfamily ATPase